MEVICTLLTESSTLLCNAGRCTTRELAPIVGREILIELLERLPTEIIAIHQKQHALRLCMLDQPIDKSPL